MAILILLLGFLVLMLGHEAWRRERALAAIPIRIHVNGTRGKSSVTRLIAAALREGGIRTVAKTTGSKARLILPDGSEEPVIRMGSPNICEQITILDRARRAGAKAMVMECMAVRPDLQEICERQIMRSTIGVITNIRPDHLDVMGPTIDDVAVALATTIPKRGETILGDPRYSGSYRRIAESRGSRFSVARPEEIPDGAMDGFGHVEHEENVATALIVSRILGIPDTIALQGMYKALPDVGACTRSQFFHKDCQIEFINIFAANDLESTIAIWQKVGLGNPGGMAAVALLNLRGDRIDRSLQFVEAVETGLRADFYLVVGDFPESVRRRFERQVPAGRLLTLGKVPPDEIFDSVAALCGSGARVGGVGNIGGLGHQILEFVASRGGGSC